MKFLFRSEIGGDDLLAATGYMGGRSPVVKWHQVLIRKLFGWYFKENYIPESLVKDGVLFTDFNYYNIDECEVLVNGTRLLLKAEEGFASHGCEVNEFKVITPFVRYSYSGKYVIV